ncbi:tigger transposable element-derived protein 1-like [Centruroides vittatus]|uniref:tigger transposable element-derived protein 1-like n=1 Tax=Centruroides vittatus TaxID=120091 RepID=UPI003510A2BF
MAKSTISTILKNKETIKRANVAKGVTTLTKQRPQILEEVEKLLLIFINEKQLRGDSISETFICEKALEIYDDLVKKTPGTSTSAFVFKASRGWFENFKNRSGIHNVVRHGEGASSDKEGAEKFVAEFSKLIMEEGYAPQQVFNADETGLFWKKMPKRTYITKEEKALPGHKPMKDRLTLLLCGNASGDFKVKPLLVYHSDNPRVFKRNNIMKSKLPVMWRANSKAWVTRQFFVEWVHEVFAPSVKEYLQEKNLPIKCLLLLDNAPAHPPGLEEDLVEEFDFIRVKYLPPNTTALLQPMDQQVISNFKKLYTKSLFRKCFEVTNDTRLTLKEFWKNHFHILNCVHLIDNAWNQVTYRTMNSAWRKLWPDCVPERDFEGFNEEIVDDIVSIGQSIGLEVDNEDIEELVEDHSTELTTEELEHLQNEQQRILAEDMSSGEEEGKEDIPSSVIKEICAKWGDVQAFVEKSHPDTMVANRAVHLFNENVMSHFRKILQKRQKQQTMDKFLIKDLPAQKRQKREATPEVPLPDVFMEGDSPSRQ